MRRFTIQKVSLYGMLAVFISVLLNPEIAMLIIILGSFLHDILGFFRFPNPFSIKKPDWLDFVHAFVGGFFGSGIIYLYLRFNLIGITILLVVFMLMLVLEKFFYYKPN